MPIYEYSCQKCRARVEVMQKITDKPLKRCKSCGGKLEKEWSTTSFQLKGTGWYVTDYAKKKTGDSDKEPAKSVSAPEAKTDGAAETKTASAETKSEPAAVEETKPKKTSRAVSTSKPSKSD
ncbi:MAG TPA: zinc ribbon domain-containing protein [Pyrinomonadaceae bacterium]